MRRQRTPRGVTLLEVLVAMGLVALATLALVSANAFAARASSRSYRRYIAMRLAQQRLEAVTLGDAKQRLLASAAAMNLDGDPKPDAVPQDCTENGAPPELCDGTTLPKWMGWVDIYGRPCRGDDKAAAGYQPTCLFRRYILYVHTIRPSPEGDIWNILVAVSHAPDGTCHNTKEGDSQCVVTTAVLTR